MRGTSRYLLLFAPFLTGCALKTTAPRDLQPGASISGYVHGGQQAVSGASIYLFAANNTGYGGADIVSSAANASVSLLTSSVLATNPANSGLDSAGRSFVTTDSHGSFAITGDYGCTAGQQVYLYAVGGSPGAARTPPRAFSPFLATAPAAPALSLQAIP